MICVVQRVLEAKVAVEGRIVGEIGAGLLVLASVVHNDTLADAEWLAQKLVGLRIFQNGDKDFDVDVRQIGGSILLVSNFTVAADTRSGRRPSLIAAAKPEKGQSVFNHLVTAARATGIPVATGVFRAEMQVHIVNDGPATFIVNTDSKQA